MAEHVAGQKPEGTVTAQMLRSEIGRLMGLGHPLGNGALQRLLAAPGCPYLVMPGQIRRRYYVSAVWAWILTQTRTTPGPEISPAQEPSLHRRRSGEGRRQPQQFGLTG